MQNWNFRAMRTYIFTSLLSFYLLFCTFSLSAQNEDTPNLSFEQGNFTGWNLYFGEYFYHDAGNTTIPNIPPYSDGGTDTYKMIWSPVTANNLGGRIIVNPMKINESDPTIACNTPPFLINPPGMPMVARIGVPTATEGFDKVSGSNCTNNNNWTRGKYATAEKMTYTFTVTPKTTLLTYKFAAVLHVPVEEANSANHTGEELPAYKVNVTIVDPISGEKPMLPCAGYDLSANVNAAGVERNKSTAQCPAARRKGNANANEYIFQNWTTGSFDLSLHVGKTVTIEVETHDCLYTWPGAGCNGNITAGNHAAYGYFWAETRELKLDIQNCVGEDARITAPEGFTTYIWRRSDSRPVNLSNGNPRIASIPQSQMSPGVTYYCEMQGDMNGCSPIVLSTELIPIRITPAFSYNNEFCEGKVAFTNESTIVEDEIRTYSWDFGDGFTSDEKDPVHEYAKSGQYQVTLKVISKQGCESTTTKPVVVRYFPSLNIDGDETVCQGEKFVLSVLNTEVGSTFLWSNGSAEQSMIEIAKTSQHYSVTVTDVYHCKYTKEIYVSVQPVPVLLISGNSEVCLNDSVTWKAMGADSYVWSNGMKTPETKFRPLSDEVISVTGKLTNGCAATLDTIVRVNPLPIIAIIGVDSICRNTSAVYSATGAVNYVWGDFFMGQNRTISPLNDTTYTVTGVDEKGCKSTASKSIIVKDVPELDYTAKDTVCANEMVSIVARGAVSYQWQDGTTDGVYMEFPTKLGDVIYSVTGRINDCVAKLDIPVHVLRVPSIWIDGLSKICFGNTTTLTAGGNADTYRWNTGETIGTIEVAPPSTSFYQLQGFGANGCTSIVEKEVIVHPKPNIVITGDKSICENNYVTLEAQGGISYTWDNGIISPTTTRFIGVGSFTFTVTGTDANFCQNTATYTVSSVPLPGLSVNGNPNVCLGETLTLVGQGATSYKWSNGSSTPMYQAQPTTSGIVTMTGTVANCSSSIDIPISILVPPTLYITGDSAVCKSTPFNLSVHGADSYEWDTGDKTASISYKLEENTIYKVRGKDENSSCVSEIKAEVKIFPVPNIKIRLEDQFSCPEQPDTVILTASGGVRYQWSSIPYNWDINEKASQRLRFKIEENTQVFVEGESQYGCFDSDTFMIKRLVHPPFIFTVEPNVIEKGSTTVRFKGLSPNDYQWYWTPGEGANERKGGNVTHSFSTFEMDADSILVSVRNINERGCGYEGEEWVYVWRDFWAPNAFSPNGDKLNDTFRFIAEDYIYKFTFVIFNRLGEIVFTGQSSHDEWDGTYKGLPCPWGVYGWVVNYKSDYKGVQKEGEKKGFVTLVR